jgi:hypothetical protein
MEANSTILVEVDLVLQAERAEFAGNCLIDARGAAGASGGPGPTTQVTGVPGSTGANGANGGAGKSVTIKAGLAAVGGLTAIADGGRGGAGGVGGAGGDGAVGLPAGAGGQGGRGGAGGAGGKITIAWTRLAAGLPKTPGAAPQGHLYQSNGGQGGVGGPGGPGGAAGPFSNERGAAGATGVTGPTGASGSAQVTWRSDVASLLWAQAQDMGPPPREGHALAYDPRRDRLVLFGGVDGGRSFGDTWEWDGKLWTQVADTGPPPRAYHGMAYDGGGQVLAFGGSPLETAGRSYLNDTWAWDGQTWVQLADTGPSPRQSPAMASDPTRQRVVLFGGGTIDVQAGANHGLGDTWEWDGAQWTQLADTGPSARLDARMAYDADDANLILFGGVGDDPAPADTWAWDGQRWREATNMGPSARTGHAMAASDSAVILFGGVSLPGPGRLKDTWAWTQGAWRQVQDMGPQARGSHAMAAATEYGGGIVTLFGGQGAELLCDTWRFADRP